MQTSQIRPATLSPPRVVCQAQLRKYLPSAASTAKHERLGSMYVSTKKVYQGVPHEEDDLSPRKEYLATWEPQHRGTHDSALTLCSLSIRVLREALSRRLGKPWAVHLTSDRVCNA